MADVVEPLGGVAPAGPVSPHGGGLPLVEGGGPRTIIGQVIAVYREHGHSEEGHRLDVTVGAEAHTEILVRVESGSCGDLEGKRVVIHTAE